MTSHDDPGWGSALRASGPLLFVPFFPLLVLILRRKSLDALTALRVLFLHYASALILILIVSAIIQPRLLSEDAPVPILVVLGAGSIGSLFGLWWSRGRPLDTSNEQALAQSYRTLFFLSMAFAQSPALFGFVGVFVLDALWPYLVGLAISAYASSTFAPSARNLDRQQQQITASGSDLSLREAIQQQSSP
ncbi:MAG TPA: hypothetical protein VG709_02715 [Actinomycetota bacterium]|nr:hypothetical protein [Actinomycetota bacterium]